MNKPDDIFCVDCNIVMEPLYPKQYGFKLHGWVCHSCQNFIKAIGRERFFQYAPQTTDNRKAKK